MYAPTFALIASVVFFGYSLAQNDITTTNTESITICIPEYKHTLDATTCDAAEVTATEKVGTPTSCYWKEGTALSYQEGLMVCKAKGGHLMHLYSRDVGDLISNKLLPDPDEAAWVGAKKNGQGAWAWETVEGIQTEVSNLAHGIATGLQECSVYTGGIMVPTDCTVPKTIVCEKDYPRAKFSIVQGKTLMSEALIGTESTSDSWECGLACLRKLSCVGYTYNESTKECKMTNKKAEDFPKSYQQSSEEIMTTFNRVM